MLGDYKNQVLALRQRLPVGLQQAARLLASAGGDLLQAEQLFVQAAVTDLTTAEPRVTAAEAERHLHQQGFDLPRALQSIREEKYTLTERILARYRHKPEEAVRLIAGAAEKMQQLPRPHSWLDFAALARLPTPLRCLLAVAEWLLYEECEGLNYAVYFHLPEVAELVDRQLHLPELAALLREARHVHEAQRAEQRAQLLATGSLGPTAEFNALDKQFTRRRPQLLTRLCELAQAHPDLFP